MVVVMASATRTADALINYALDDKPDQMAERYVMASGVNGLLVSVAKQQMRGVRKKWGKDRRGAFVQAYHVIQSFGKDELLPNSPDSWMTAQQLGRALAEDRFPGRQTLVVTQRDGKTGCLHNHIIVNSIETRTGKSLNSSIVMHSRLVEAHERVLETKGFEQRGDLKQAFSDAHERYERGEPSGLRRAGSSQQAELREFQRHILWETDCDLADEFGLPHDPEPFSLTVLTASIDLALADPASIDWASFVEAGARHRVRIEQRGKKGRGISYGMMREQPDGTWAEPTASDRRRSSTLGHEYEMETVERALGSHFQAQQATTVTAPAYTGIRLPSAHSANHGKSIDERLREAMAEVDKQMSAYQRPAFDDYIAAKHPAPDLQLPANTNARSEREAPITVDATTPSRSPELPTPNEETFVSAPATQLAPPQRQVVEPDFEAPSTRSPAEELRIINRRNRRLGLPLVSAEEHAANRAMTPDQRRFKMKHPELFDRATESTEQRNNAREYPEPEL
jgi:hypothetical protein